jgi:hypothetical protein
MIKSYSSSSRTQAFLETVLEELDASDPEEALHLLRRMKRLLSQYHEDRKRLDRLGLDDLDEVFDAMLAMKRRVERLRDRVDAYQTAQDKLRAIQDALDVDASPAKTVETIESITDQLESLYAERERLFEAGVSNAGEAVRLIQTMREKLDKVQATDSDAEDGDPLDRIQEELGVSDPESVIDMVESMEAQLVADLDSDGKASDESGGPTSTLIRTLERQMRAAERGVAELPETEGPPLLPPDQLEALDEQSPDALDALDVGIVALGDDGELRLATDHSPLLPGIAEAKRGDSFFDHVPSARNPILREAFQRGRVTGHLDVRLTYTFPRPGGRDPLPLRLHLYRPDEASPTWLLYDAFR